MTSPSPLEAAAQLACLPRSRGLYLARLDSLNVETKKEWQPGYWPEAPWFKAGTTWCSRAFESGCKVNEVPIPEGLKANEQAAWLLSPEGAAAGWRKCTAQEAAQRAEAGFPTAGTYFEEPHGHILFAVPAIDGSGLHAWQAGRTNFTNKPIRFSFTAAQLEQVIWVTHD